MHVYSHAYVPRRGCASHRSRAQRSLGSEHNRHSCRCQSLQAEEQPGRQRALSLLPQGQQALLRTFPLVSP